MGRTCTTRRVLRWGCPILVALAVTTVQAALTFDTALLKFEPQSLQTTSQPRPLVVTNSGSTAVSVTSVRVPAPFGGSHDCGQLPPGASCTIQATFTPISVTPLSVVLEVQSNAGVFTTELWGYGEKSLVTHYYWSILRRAPEPAGAQYWNGEAARLVTQGADVNETWYAMAMAFFTSVEYAAFARSDLEYIRDLYTTFFNRAPDVGGQQYWSGQLLAGLPREVVLAQFMFSSEFVGFSKGIFGDPTVRAEIDTAVDFYRGLLGRLPDNAGLQHWIQQFRLSQCLDPGGLPQKIETISSSFAGSAEYASRGRSNAQYIGDLYNSFMRRGGDLNGVLFWIGALESGQRTREEVRREFMKSPEFQLRQAQVLAEGCLPSTCDMNPAYPSNAFDWKGGAYTLSVTTAPGCQWTVAEEIPSSWLGFARVGDAISYTVPTNNSTGNRNTRLVFTSTLPGTAIKKHSITQYGAPVVTTDSCLLQGNCRSNGVCCARGLLGCGTSCFGSLGAAYNGGGCVSFATYCPN